MTERSYRLMIGLSLLVILYLNSSPAMYGLIALMVFEAATNWRIPLLVSRLRYGMQKSIIRQAASNLADTGSVSKQSALAFVFSGCCS